MLDKYDYRKAVLEDVKNYIENEIKLKDFRDLVDLRDYLNDTLWINDSVTGNASGSYTFSTWKAEEFLCHNLDLLGEAMEEFSCKPADLMEKGPEWADVTIRCYLLAEAIDIAIEPYDIYYSK